MDWLFLPHGKKAALGSAKTLGMKMNPDIDLDLVEIGLRIMQTLSF